jgi:hypothetical protein
MSGAFAERKRADPTIYRRIEWPSKLKRYYGITPEDYYAMLSAQGGVCAICKTDKPCARRHKIQGESEFFFIDHCHTTGKVRGLLCNACNRGLGILGDDPKRLIEAADYLRRSA